MLMQVGFAKSVVQSQQCNANRLCLRDQNLEEFATAKEDKVKDEEALPV